MPMSHMASYDVASLSNRPISVYRLDKTPIQSCGQSVSAPRGKAVVGLNAHTESRAKRQRSVREAIYRNRHISARPYLARHLLSTVRLLIASHT